jgi:hypothetical protein
MTGRDGNFITWARTRGEQVNLIEREPAVARRLAARLQEWLKATKAVLPERNPDYDPAWPGWGLTGAEKPTPPAR